jgi:hypothetical protein
MAYETGHYVEAVSALATTCLGSATQATAIASILADRTVTLSAMTVRVSSDLDMSHAEGYPCCHLYPSGAGQIVERLNRVQDWSVPVQCSVLYEAMDPSAAMVTGLWYAQLVKMCIESTWRSIPYVWLVTVDSSMSDPQRPDESRYLYRIDLAIQIWYRTRRNG